MTTPPNRIAAVALVLLVLAGVGAWWWQLGREPYEARDLPTALVRKERGTTRPAAVWSNQEAQFLRKAGITAADAAALDRCTNDLNALVQARTRNLGEATAARARAAYALIAPSTVEAAQLQDIIPGEGLQLMEALQARRSIRLMEAWSQAADDPDVRWLAAAQCSSDGGCSRVRQAVTQAEPDNISGWLLAMESARQRKDPAAMEAAFQRAGKAGRYDRHAGSATALILDAYGGLPTPASCGDPRLRVVSEKMRNIGIPNIPLNATDVVTSLAGLVESVVFPPFGALQEVCDTALPAMSATRRTTCSRIYAMMAENGGSLLEQGLATRRLVELQGDAPEADIWRERLREHAWLMAQQTDVRVHGQMRPQDYVLDEVRTLQAILESMGRWPAPDGWLPNDEYSRSLILTGRPPPDSHR